jgi:hypothetical protein
MVNSNYTNYYKVALYGGSIVVDASTNNLLTSQPSNFGIPSLPVFSSGYNSYCVIGLNSIELAISSSSFTRTAWFNTNTQPISGILNDVYQTGGVYE